MSGLEIVAFAMGAVGFVEAVLAAWDHMEQRRQDHRQIQILAEDLKLFGLQDRRDDLKISLELAQKVIRDRSVPKEKKHRLARDFQHLSVILDSLPGACDAVTTTTSSPTLIFRRKTKADRELKSKLAAFSEALSNFHQAVMNLRAITLTESSLLLKAQDLTLIGSPPEMARISEAVLMAKASYVQPGEGNTVVGDILLESRLYKEYNKAELEQEMRSMATTLNSALPAWNIPSLIGYRTNPEKKTMDLVFDRPHPTKELISLASIYVSGTPEPSLNVRIALCSQLAIAVIQAHTLGIVHKHIRPDNLLIALSRNEEGGIAEASLYLAGWQNSRIIKGVATARRGESTVQKAIYQHPKRRTEGGSAKEDYSVGHDIYSLGVCMLELLDWDTLIRPGQSVFAPPLLSGSYQRMFEHLGYHKAITWTEDDDISLAELYTQDAEKVQSTLIAMAKTGVPQKTGNAMANLVCKCLSFWDTDGGSITEAFDAEVFDVFNKLLAVI
jgi:serine/threonine protein kinase